MHAPFSRGVRRAYDRVGAQVGRVVPAVVGLVVLVGLVLAGLPALGSDRCCRHSRTATSSSGSRRPPGTSLAEMDRITGLAAAELRELHGVESVGTHVGRAVGADEVVDVDASEIWLTVADDADYDETRSRRPDDGRALPGSARPGEHLRRRPDDRCQCHDRGRARGAGLRRGLPDAPGAPPRTSRRR